MKITLYYDFNERSHDGRDSINIKAKDFAYEVKLKKKDLKLTLQELIDLHHDEALAEASYRARCKLADDLGNPYY